MSDVCDSLRIMLKNFLYLNTAAVDGYLSSLEDGLRATSERIAGGSAGVGGRVGVGAVSANAEKGSSNQEKTEHVDTPEARFERLREQASLRAEQTGWRRVLNPDVDLANLPNGAIVDLDCEIYVPDAIKMIAKGKEAIGTIEAFAGAAGSAAALGYKVDNLPDTSQLSAMSSVLNAFKSDLVLVGEPDDTEWSVSGRLDPAYIRDDIEGFATVIGKVSRHITAGQWRHLLTMPGMDVIPRAKRRELERRGPESGQEDSWLAGPALVLDILAVFR